MDPGTSGCTRYPMCDRSTRAGRQRGQVVRVGSVAGCLQAAADDSGKISKASYERWRKTQAPRPPCDDTLDSRYGWLEVVHAAGLRPKTAIGSARAKPKRRVVTEEEP